MVRIADVLEVAIKKYMKSLGLDVVRIYDYEEETRHNVGGCDTCGWGGADPVVVEVTYADSKGQHRYWNYIGNFADFIRALDYTDTDYDELDSDPLSFS